MKLNDLINRAYTTRAWEAGDKIPWNEPEFSRRVLQNHLAQDHDWASRRQAFIERHLAWLAEHLEPGSSVLDLACGPGLYAQRLAEMGHRCRGVDFSPAAIDYARDRATDTNLAAGGPDGLFPAAGQSTAEEGPIRGAAEYVLEDIRLYQTDDKFDCLIFVFGEINVFTETDARLILGRAAGFLRPGGLFVLEAHTFEGVRQAGQCLSNWWTCEKGAGLMSTRPHLCLQENNWDEESATATSRYFIVDGDTAEVSMFSSSMTAYTMSRYEQLLIGAGFHSTRVLSPEQWPKGEPFEGVMTTVVCLKG